MNFWNLLKYKIYIAKTCYSIKHNGGRVGKNVKLSIQGKFDCGNDVILNSKGIDLLESCKIHVFPTGYLSIGSHVGISQTSILCKDNITIGDYVDIGAGCLIMDTDFHNIDWKAREDRSLGVQSAQKAPIHIEDHVFIGARCIITKGVTIGARSVIAAGSVVVKDVPADCIAGGNPCKVIKYLES